MPTWVDVPQPPAPIGINVFPLDPSVATCWTGSIPNQWYFTNQVLTVTGIYIPLVRATVTKDTPYKQSVSVTTGVSDTQSQETAFGMTLGVTADWLSINASFTETLGHSTTLTTSSTLLQEFDIAAQTSAQISAVWWQLMLTFKVTATIEFGGFSLPYSRSMQDNTPTFVSTQFPAVGTLLNRAPNAGRFGPAAQFATPAA